MSCDGPLIWFDANPGAILECAADGCEYVVITGSWNDQAHAHTDVMREGLAS